MLECDVPDESVPAAWYLEDQRLMPSSKYGMEQKGTRRRLTIRDVAADDDGVYLCETPDGAKSIAELTVKGKSKVTLLEKDQFFIHITQFSVIFMFRFRSSDFPNSLFSP